MTTKRIMLMSEYFSFLDILRESGVTNMFGAASYIVEEFGVTKSEAIDILIAWMNHKSVNS